MAGSKSWYDQVKEAEICNKLELTELNDIDTENLPQSHMHQPLSPVNSISHTTELARISEVRTPSPSNNLLAIVQRDLEGTRAISNETLHLVRRQTSTASLARTYARGVRSGIIVHAYYCLPVLPIIYQFNVLEALSNINNKDAVTNLISKNEVSIRQLCQSMKSFASKLAINDHKCEYTARVFDGSSTECSDCVCLFISRMSLNAQGRSIEVLDTTNVSRILIGFMLYAKSWIAQPVLIDDPKTIVYAPTSLIPKILASTIGGAYSLDVDTSESIHFKSQDCADFQSYSMLLTMLHLSFTQRILETRMRSICFSKDGQSFTIPFRTMSVLREDLGVVEARATLTSSMLSTLHFRGMKLSNIPCLKMLYNIHGVDKLNVSQHDLTEMIRNNLVYIYTRVCYDAEYAASIGPTFSEKIKKNRILVDFLRFGTFKTLGHSSGVIPAKIEYDTNTRRINETFWHFENASGAKYDMDGLLAIFNPPVLGRLTQLMHSSLSSVIHGNVEISLLWIVEYFKSCYVLITPFISLDGTHASSMSKNEYGRRLESLDALSWDDDTSSVNNTSHRNEYDINSLLKDSDKYTGRNALNVLDYHVAVARATTELENAITRDKRQKRLPRNRPSGAQSLPTSPAKSKSGSNSKIEEVEDTNLDLTESSFPHLYACKSRFNKR